MDALIDLTTPSRAAADLGLAAVALDYEKVAGLQPVAVEFTAEQLELLDLLKVQMTALDVGHAALSPLMMPRHRCLSASSRSMFVTGDGIGSR